MFEMLIKQMMPADFDMDKAMGAIKDVGARIVRTDERTARIEEALQRIETKLDRIVTTSEGKDNA
jgi:hypothetical protein